MELGGAPISIFAWSMANAALFLARCRAERRAVVEQARADTSRRPRPRARARPAAAGVGSPCRGTDRVVARLGKRREGRERRVQEPAEPHALARARVRRRGSCRRSSRRCRSAAARGAPSARLGRGRGRNARTGWRSRRRHRRIEEAVVLARRQRLAFQERDQLVEHGDIAGDTRHSARRRRRARHDRRRCACARPGRNAAATNAGRRPRRTVAPPRAAGARASSRGTRRQAPCRPATDRESRRRRSPDRRRSAPRCGRPASDRAASR